MRSQLMPPQKQKQQRTLTLEELPRKILVAIDSPPRGHYTIYPQEILGAGAYARVCRATPIVWYENNNGSPTAGFPMACKLLHWSSTPGANNAAARTSCTAYRREVVAFERLFHHAKRQKYWPSSLIECMGRGTLPEQECGLGWHFITMPRLPSLSLHQFLCDYKYVGKQLEPNAVFYIAHQLSAALLYMHAAGVSHNDIKAENIAIHPGTLAVVLYDLGFALVCPPDASPDSWLITDSSVTPLFQSPEHTTAAAEALPRNPFRSDIWALGHVFFALVTGGHIAMELLQCRTYPQVLHQLCVTKPSLIELAGLEETTEDDADDENNNDDAMVLDAKTLSPTQLNYWHLLSATLCYNPIERMDSQTLHHWTGIFAQRFPMVSPQDAEAAGVDAT